MIVLDIRYGKRDDSGRGPAAALTAARAHGFPTDDTYLRVLPRTVSSHLFPTTGAWIARTTQGLRAMFTRSPDSERKIPTTVKLTHSQRRRAEQKARELGMSFHAFMRKAIDDAASQKQAAQSG